MQKPPTLRQLQYFVTLAETQHFRRAAARLRITQPTLTIQVAALETGLGVQLFERSRTGTALTPEGRELCSHARGVLRELQGLVDQAEASARGPAGTYRLGVTPTLGPYLLPQVLPGIHRRFDALRFFVREGAPRLLEDDLLGGEHDLILTALPLVAGDLIVIPLFTEPLQLVLPADHRLAGKERIEPADLQGEPVLTLEEHHLFHRQIAELCERFGAHVLRDYEGTSLDTLRQMVVMGMGIAFLPALYVRSEIHQPEELRVTTVQGERMERVHALAWRSTSSSSGLFERLADELRAQVALRLADTVHLVPRT